MTGKWIAGGVLAAGLAAAGAIAVAQQMPGQGHGHGQHGHMSSQAQGGGMGMRHGMMRMLQGVDTTEHETQELADLFARHAEITRTVENLPDGIRTVTEAHDPALAATIVSHVAGMIARVEENRDPQVFIQSPTLDIIFRNRDLIETTLEPTPNGIIVTQTSTDPETVAALQLHAEEVSDMVERGMAAVHDAMMGRMQAMR